MRKSKFRSCTYILLLTFFITVFASVAGASATGTVAGKVVDPLGAVVPKAHVTLLQDGKVVSVTETDQEGNFAFSPVDVGQYLVRVEAPGFAPQESQPVHLAPARTVSIEVILQVGTLRQQIVVTDTGTSLPESQVGASVTVLDQSELDAFNKLDLLDALRQVPGLAVVQTGERGGTTSVFARGGTSDFNKVLIDGIPANDIGGAVRVRQSFGQRCKPGGGVSRGQQCSVRSRRPGERDPGHYSPGLFYDSGVHLLGRRWKFSYFAPGSFAGGRFSPIRLFHRFHGLRNPKQPSQ